MTTIEIVEEINQTLIKLITARDALVATLPSGYDTPVPRRRRRGVTTPEGKKRIGAAQKARWDKWRAERGR